MRKSQDITGRHSPLLTVPAVISPRAAQSLRRASSGVSAALGAAAHAVRAARPVPLLRAVSPLSDSCRAGRGGAGGGGSEAEASNGGAVRREAGCSGQLLESGAPEPSAAAAAAAAPGESVPTPADTGARARTDESPAR